MNSNENQPTPQVTPKTVAASSLPPGQEEGAGSMASPQTEANPETVNPVLQKTLENIRYARQDMLDAWIAGREHYARYGDSHGDVPDFATWIRLRDNSVPRGNAKQLVAPVTPKSEKTVVRQEEGGCLKCDGTGAVDSGGETPWGSSINEPCPDCEGTGRTNINATLPKPPVRQEEGEWEIRCNTSGSQGAVYCKGVPIGTWGPEVALMIALTRAHNASLREKEKERGALQELLDNALIQRGSTDDPLICYDRKTFIERLRQALETEQTLGEPQDRLAAETEAHLANGHVLQIAIQLMHVCYDEANRLANNCDTRKDGAARWTMRTLYDAANDAKQGLENSVREAGLAHTDSVFRSQDSPSLSEHAPKPEGGKSCNCRRIEGLHSADCPANTDAMSFRPRIHNKKMVAEIRAVVMKHSGNEMLADQVVEHISAPSVELATPSSDGSGLPKAEKVQCPKCGSKADVDETGWATCRNCCWNWPPSSSQAEGKD